jgi:hypothetical protein
LPLFQARKKHHNIGFEEKRHYFSENWQKTPKIGTNSRK